MRKRRRNFSREFKQEVVAFVVENGCNFVAAGRSLGVSSNLIERWKREFVRKSASFVRYVWEPKAVCGELVLKLRQAGDIDLGIDYASGRSADSRLLIVSSRFFRSVCHRPTHNGSADRCRNP